MAYIIYLLEHSQRIIQEIVNISIKNGFEIYIFKKFADILIDLKRHRPKSIIINEKLLPDSYDEFLSINNFNIVVYGDTIELDRKLNLYEMRVSRVLELPYFQPGMLIQGLVNQAKFMELLGAESNAPVIRTSLQKFSVSRLLESTLLDEKSFVLKIIDNGWYGYLKVCNGNIEKVRCTNKSGTNALLDILFHSRGDVMVKYFSGSGVNSTAVISTTGILMEYTFQMNRSNAFKSKFNRANPVFQIKSKDIGSQLSEVEKTILSQIENQQSLKQIYQTSPVSLSSTIDFLEKMIQDGFVEVLDDPRTLEKLPEEDIEMFLAQILPSGQHRGQVLVLGSTESANKAVMESLKNIFSSLLFSNKSLDTCEVSVDSSTKLCFIGIPLEDYLQENLSDVLKYMVGIIYVIDFAQPLEFDYKKYVLRQILTEYQVPVAIGFINLTKMNAEVISEFRRKLEISADLPILSLDPNKFMDMEALIMQLIGVKTKEVNQE
jgi:hypothetical protein